ncbi:MAG: peroxiredoxin [Candidatus Hodarchaeales archaeon]
MYKLDGTPLYSQCFGGFCSNLAINNDLLQGFISALSTVPEQLNQKEESNYTATMGKFKLIFNKNSQKEIFTCLGVDKNVKEGSEKIFLSIFDIIDKFWMDHDKDYNFEIKENLHKFEHDFYHEVLLPWSLKTGVESVNSKHVHPPGYDCPLKTMEPSKKNGRSLWEIFMKNFNIKTKSVKKIKTKAGKIEIGSQAPDFEAKTDKGEKIKLSDYLGKYVILYFYPQAKTPGCVKEAEGFRDVYDDLKTLNTEVIGVSTDSSEVLLSFKNDLNIPYDLITDYSKDLANLYSGTGILRKANRITYLINPQGKIIKIWKLTGLFAQMGLYGHAQEVKDALAKEIE